MMSTSDDYPFIIRPRNQSVFGVVGGLNSNSLIQPSKTLLIELTEIHIIYLIVFFMTKNSNFL